MSITSGMAGDELMDLGNNERRMLKAMLSKPNQAWSLEQLLSVTGWNDQVHVAGAGKGLQEEGMVEVKETTSRLVSLGEEGNKACLLYTSPSPRDPKTSRMPSSA